MQQRVEPIRAGPADANGDYAADARGKGSGGPPLPTYSPVPSLPPRHSSRSFFIPTRRLLTPAPTSPAQVLDGTDFPADAIVYDVSGLREPVSAYSSWDVKLHPAPPEPYQFIGYLVNSEWNTARAHSTNHLVSF